MYLLYADFTFYDRGNPSFVGKSDRFWYTWILLTYLCGFASCSFFPWPQKSANQRPGVKCLFLFFRCLPSCQRWWDDYFALWTKWERTVVEPIFSFIPKYNKHGINFGIKVWFMMKPVGTNYVRGHSYMAQII